jgi:hypothetical protein
MLLQMSIDEEEQFELLLGEQRRLLEIVFNNAD